jgi:hypothetical protein
MQIRRATEEDLEALLALNASIQLQHAEALPKIFSLNPPAADSGPPSPG